MRIIISAILGVFPIIPLLVADWNVATSSGIGIEKVGLNFSGGVVTT